jgi:alpha-tubulin suppressor-like RCC1 family protein
MKEKSNHLKSILNSIAIALVVPLFIFASQTSSLAVQPSVAAGSVHTVGLKSDGTVVAVGDNDEGQLNVGSWTDIVQVAAGGYHTVGVKSDGTVVAVGIGNKPEEMHKAEAQPK